MNPITIIGGGLAGLSLGIILRKHSVPVTIIEAGSYPRHRVCGEFICGAGLAVLRDLGLPDDLQKIGSRTARDAVFFTARRSLGRRDLPSPALCISRYDLDASLAQKFCEMNGELQTGNRWRNAKSGEGIVWATGRRRHLTEKGCGWFGLKIHARGVTLEADLEMHLRRDAYVGLNRLASGEVNICGLFRRQPGPVPGGTATEQLRGNIESILFTRLERAVFDPTSLCAVAGLGLHAKEIDSQECRIGDALTMIPPITGNGMSMAFESAQIAAVPLLSYARGEKGWLQTTAQVAQSFTEAFRARLLFAGLLHRVMFSRIEPIARLFLRNAPLWRMAFALTR